MGAYASKIVDALSLLKNPFVMSTCCNKQSIDHVNVYTKCDACDGKGKILSPDNSTSKSK